MEKIIANIVSQEPLANDIYNMVIRVPSMTKEAKAGQFVSLFSKDGSKLLPRPISICEIDKKAGTLRLVYRVAGSGTKEFSGLSDGTTIAVMGPLGNGFPLKKEKAIVIGGGIGIPPMLQLAKELDAEKSIVLGFRDETFLIKDFEAQAPVYISSEDGKTGVKGTVLNAIQKYNIKGDIIYACGPLPMLKAVKEYAKQKGIEAQISLEERMACGIGACLACTCNTEKKDEHSNINRKRICKEGPVFLAEEVILS